MLDNVRNETAERAFQDYIKNPNSNTIFLWYAAEMEVVGTDFWERFCVRCSCLEEPFASHAVQLQMAMVARRERQKNVSQGD
ncbi:hypothetical protein KC845_03705 [Candidatus Kaiserbacteria bacterium]|nr:hypothetical protein [Candidatus Kaiserbacteria bacterium]